MKWAILLLAAAPAWGWWEVGHKAVAGLAYDLLAESTRRRVDALLKKHPDYSNFVEGAPAGERQRHRYAFMKAAYWPDLIKADPRFYDETKRDAKPTEVQPGFADMKRHGNWHYINVGFSTDGAPVPDPPTPNFLTQYPAIVDAVGKEDAHMLPWLLHLVGDIHQPMHCVSRFQPGSDLGGNAVKLASGMNLHAYWDSRLGETDTPEIVEAVVVALKKRPAEAHPVTDPGTWVKEGFEIAKTVAYSFGDEPGYAATARKVAFERAALAGQRLAAVLNRMLP